MSDIKYQKSNSRVVRITVLDPSTSVKTVTNLPTICQPQEDSRLGEPGG